MSLPKRLRDKIEFKHAATPRVDRLLDLDRLRPRRIPNQSVPAHRLVYEKLRGPIPEGRNLLRTCPRQLCVNPNHMEIRGAA